MARTKTTRLRLRIDVDTSDKRARFWYPAATKLIKELYPDSWSLFVDFLAATSPRTHVKKNWRLATSLIEGYRNRYESPKAWGDLLGSLLPAHLQNVIRALQGKPLHGYKVSRFAANLKGDLDAVTIDVWICKAYGLPHKALTPKVYDRLERKIQKDAMKYGLEPANYQALIWYSIRRISGKKDKSFLSVYREIRCEIHFDFVVFVLCFRYGNYTF